MSRCHGCSHGCITIKSLQLNFDDDDTIRQRNKNIGADNYETAQTCSPTCLGFLQAPSTTPEKRYVNVFHKILYSNFELELHKIHEVQWNKGSHKLHIIQP